MGLAVIVEADAVARAVVDGVAGVAAPTGALCSVCVPVGMVEAVIVELIGGMVESVALCRCGVSPDLGGGSDSDAIGVVSVLYRFAVCCRSS